MLACPRAALTPAVQEFYADYWALDNALVSLELENNVACFMPQTWESQVRGTLVSCWLVVSPRRLTPHRGALPQSTQRTYDRIVDGIGAALLTLKKRPVIRYSQTCEIPAPAAFRGRRS